MFGVELAVGYVFAWAVRKARRAAGTADGIVDRAVDAGMERVHQIVTERLDGDGTLARVEEEAASGAAELSPRTRQRLQLALEDEAERDPAFAQALEEAVSAAKAAQGTSVTASGNGVAVGGDVTIRAEGAGSVAALTMGDVTIGTPPPATPPTAR
ncbi:hypothetical protein [Streptomyces sp. NRRL F-5123]|uniref:hypothetical protein n=1 Tax=Streptomyces sp. NRRL F-5123 TaxID=1463856 RepID=UPI000693D609|nr:hypothetical protein [Streptomyces sp. NRRL F-5123]